MTVMNKLIGFRIAFVGFALGALHLYFIYMPPVSVLLNILLSLMIAYCVVKGFFRLRHMNEVKYLVTAGLLSIIIMLPEVMEKQLIVFRYWLELVPRQTDYEEKVAQMHADSNGVKHVEWLLSSWMAQNVYIVYDDDRKIHLLKTNPYDRCWDIYTRIKGNFYVRFVGCLPY